VKQVNVHFGEARVGVLAEARGGIFFEYDREFISTGHELSPLSLPLGSGLRARDSAPSMRLPGLFEDSLPDAWGERLMLEWFRRQGTAFHAVTPLMMLAYVGRRGMGALTYEPQLESSHATLGLSLHDLYEAAEQAEKSGPIDLDLLAEIGSSAGGAHPKALIGLPHSGIGEILPGASELPPSHAAWLVKFDTPRNVTTGVLEHAYALMARAAGIEMPPTRLLETRHGNTMHRHFAVKRFDRDGSERIHHHTLAGALGIAGGDLNYESLLRVTRHLTRDEDEVRRAFRRAVFNLLASNRDDHGKNHGFLYRDRQWRLGPAYDVTFRSSRKLPERGMSICGERANAGRAHLVKLAESEALDRRAAVSIIDEVTAALGQWRDFADEAMVPQALATEVRMALEIQLKNS
jgi:serine/threonine-protein kinase HipA